MRSRRRSFETVSIGVGTIVLSLNAILLGGYTSVAIAFAIWSAAAATPSTRPVQHGLWRWVSKLNKRHMLSRG